MVHSGGNLSVGRHIGIVIPNNTCHLSIFNVGYTKSKMKQSFIQTLFVKLFIYEMLILAQLKQSSCIKDVHSFIVKSPRLKQHQWFDKVLLCQPLGLCRRQYPPVTGMCAPLMQEERSEARNTIASATSETREKQDQNYSWRKEMLGK